MTMNRGLRDISSSRSSRRPSCAWVCGKGRAEARPYIDPTWAYTGQYKGGYGLAVRRVLYFVGATLQPFGLHEAR